MTPLRIRAHLPAGFVMRDPWSPAIDGILAAVVMQERLGDGYALAAAVPRDLGPVEGLPLAATGDGQNWWYTASSPIIVGEVGRQRRHIHRRFDDGHERYLADGVGKVLTAAGPYKATRLPETLCICRALEWHVIGDADEIARLLRQVMQIGARRAAGAGVVGRWEISEDGDGDLATLHRPLPLDYAQQHGRQGLVMPWGLVPPVRIGRVECIMPEARHAA